jgi:hypothetical protein
MVSVIMLIVMAPYFFPLNDQVDDELVSGMDAIKNSFILGLKKVLCWLSICDIGIFNFHDCKV